MRINPKISNERIDLLIAQLLCFAGAAGIMAMVGRLVSQFATTRFEVLAVVLMTVILAMLMVILGICLGKKMK